MANKSKAVMVEKKVFNTEITYALEEITEQLRKIYENCVNPVSAVYIISAFVRVYAQQKAYMEYLRDEAANAIQNKDIYMLKQSTFKLNNALDNKAFEDAWLSISNLYDSIITQTVDGMSGDQLSTSFKTSEEIYESCKKYYLDQKDQSVNDMIKTLQAMIDL